MKITTENNIIKIEADEEYILTNGEIYSTEIYLGINDSPENWHQISELEMPTDEGEEL